MIKTYSDLIEKVHLGEDTTIEFKREMPHRSSLADEIAAFANAKGGVILIGVDDDSEIVGLDRTELNNIEKAVVEICQDSIDPMVLIYTEKIRIDEKNILRIEIQKSLFVHKTANGYFTRQGSTKREMSPDQLARLFQTRSQARTISFDEQFVPNTNQETLNSSLYLRFITEGADDDDIEDFLLKRRLLVRDEQEIRASVAGILMCHDSPEDFLYNSYVQAVLYRGKEKDANNQLNSKDFSGPLDTQIIEAMNFVQRYNAVAAKKDIGRIDIPQYSMRAIFEAIVNAVVHRDYSKSSSKIRLFMFDDRFELYSPGALANTVTVENIRYSQATRNELLARLLSELSLDDKLKKQVVRRHFLERRGEGVGIILNESEKLSGKPPVYELFDEELRLTIFAAHEIPEYYSKGIQSPN